MTAQPVDVPGGRPDSEIDAGARQEVVRRASQLCLRAEPHTDESPCPAHLSEASRQLFGLAV